MVLGLNIASLIGLLSWLVTAYLGWLFPEHASLSRHILWALGSTLWNLFVQSMILFMWISLTRQIREQIAKRGLQPPATLSQLIHLRNRLFPWISLSILLLMIPIFSGMSVITGGLGMTWTKNPSWHRWTSWMITGYLTLLVILEFYNGLRFVGLYNQIQLHILKQSARESRQS